jgi:hypothetical protein
MKNYDTPEFNLLTHFVSNRDAEAILNGTTRGSWEAGCKQEQVMMAWHAADEAGKESLRQKWRAAIAARQTRQIEAEEAAQAASQAKEAAAEAAEKEARQVPSAFTDLPGLPLSTLCAGTHPLPAFWETYWTDDNKDQTRQTLAAAGLVLRKVNPQNDSPKSISCYELAHRKKSAAEKLMELEPLPSLAVWQASTPEQKESLVASQKAAFKAAGITAQEIKGITDRHMYEVFGCSRKVSGYIAYNFRRSGTIAPERVNLKKHFIEVTGIETLEDLYSLPINIAKAAILAHSARTVARHWSSRRDRSDMAEEMKAWAETGYKPSQAPFFVNI